MTSLEKRLKALDEAREKIIHNSFIEEQKQLEDEIRKAKEELERKAKERREYEARRSTE